MKTDFNTNPGTAHAGTLADMKPGSRVCVVAVDGDDAVGRRLAALGLLPKTRVEVVKRAPLGDPVVYELRGYRLCLRATEARRVRVTPAEESA